MLALFLGAAWSYNDIQIAQIGSYIRYRIEEPLIGGGLGWQHAIFSGDTGKRIGARVKLATRGILWGTEFLALALYLLKRSSLGWPAGRAERQGELIVFALSVLAVPLTMIVMRKEDWLVKKIAQSMKTLPGARTPAQDPAKPIS
jgi:hypothetical protein